MEKFLFSTIGVLLVAVVGIGLYAAALHPAETQNLAPNAVAAVGEAVGDTAEVLGGVQNSDDSPEVQHEESDDENEHRSTASANTSPQAPASQTPGTYTMAQVRTHNSASSCYTTINGGVYDLTKWIGQHPGGQEAILSLCGTDGTRAFQAQHGGERRPENELASLKIGILAQ